MAEKGYHGIEFYMTRKRAMSDRRHVSEYTGSKAL